MVKQRSLFQQTMPQLGQSVYLPRAKKATLTHGTVYCKCVYEYVEAEEALA
jgi:hypothetical protein